MKKIAVMKIKTEIILPSLISTFKYLLWQFFNLNTFGKYMTTSNKLIHYSNLNNFSNRENIGVTGNNDFLGTFGNSLEA